LRDSEGLIVKPNLLFLTNLYNESESEDIIITKYLRKSFNVFLAHPLDIEQLELKFDAVLIRNIWPTYDFKDQKNKWIRRLTQKRLLPKSSAEAGYLSDNNYLEKQYLVELFKAGYPVIPTVEKIADIKKLGKTKSYFLKPKDREDGIGSKKVTLNQLRKFKQKNHIFQPFINFDYELCFYFVDGKFIHALSTPTRLKHQDYKVYIPTSEDMKFAKKFVKWNNLEYGLQRIDAVRESSSQKLLLTEVEDLAPYLYLSEMPLRVQSKLLLAIKQSIQKRLL
jgi:hypothetical protein